ncbi:MAG TPA: DNA methyltransferase [Anaerolineae bacterium]|nr:DNA methyltransferase [Anaerolineae bacterium]HQI87735.1 DNA methyltransferase [Anaerolineae bacterium]
MKTQVHKGDCLEILRRYDDESVDLIYLDPPFFTQKTHTLSTRDRTREFSFEDLWSSHAEYAGFIHARLEQMWRVLAATGSLFFHCDRNAAHIIRTLLDDVFGPDMFRAEIIWHYRRWSNAQQGLLPAHQTIYYYTKSDTYTFNTLYQDYSAATNVDQILQRRKRDETGKTVYETDAAGRVIPNGGKKGVPLSDVWDIPYLNPKARERTGYPTQKPLLLLERIIKIASHEGDTVLDPFCGSGTTLVAAVSLNRKAIGIDISDDALEITRKRLEQPVKTESRLLQQGRETYKNADEEALALLRGLEYAPVQRNSGIDAVLKDDVKGNPILVRVQRPDETILEAATRLYAASRDKRAAAMFVIATQRGGYFELEGQFPPDVTIIEAPALTIADSLSQFKRAMSG